MAVRLASGCLVAALCISVRRALGTTSRGGVIRRLPRPERGRTHGHGVDDAVVSRGGGPASAGAPLWMARALVAGELHMDPATAWKMWGFGVPVLAGATLIAAGPILAVGATLVGVAGPAGVLWARRGRGDASVEAALPNALEAVARGLRTGASLRQAVADAAGRTPGSLGRELGLVSTLAERGVPLVRALEGLAARRPLPGVRLAVAALCLGAETGGAQAQAVDGVATTLRDRMAVLAEVRALSSQARLSALVISLAPLGFGAFAATTDPRTAAFLFHTAAGLALLVAGGMLDGLGWVWMNRLSRVTP